MNYIENNTKCEAELRDKTEFERVVDENQNIAKRLNELLNYVIPKLITVQRPETGIAGLKKEDAPREVMSPLADQLDSSQREMNGLIDCIFEELYRVRL